MHKIILLISVALFTLLSCEKDDPKIDLPETDGSIYYISNEGAFGFGNGSVSFYYPEEDQMVNDVFNNVNQRRPGDVLQSIGLANDKVYLVVNASNKIEIAHKESLKEIGVIQQISLPRYIEVVSANKAYVSSWGNSGQILVLDLDKGIVADSIKVGYGPEKMLSLNQHLYVTNSGGYVDDSIVTIIDQNSDQVLKEIAVGDNPIDIVKGANESVWVLCKGKVMYDGSWQIIGHTPSYLVHIDGYTQAIVKKIKISDDEHPTQLEISSDGKYLYYGGGFGFAGIYRFDNSTGQLETTPFINKDFYGVNIEPVSGDIYGFEAVNFTVSGMMYRYSSTGQLITKHRVGVGPNGISF